MALALSGVLLGGSGLAQAATAVEPAAPAVTRKIYLPLVQQGTLPPEAPAQELIYEAWQDGEIDHFTSLLYRGYAQFGDERLPVHLRGTHSGGDHTLFTEIELALPTFIPEQQALLNGFLVRPNHPDSVLKGPLAVPQAGLSAANQFGVASPQAVATFNCMPVGEDGTAWGSLSSSTLQVTVHSMCYNNPGLDATHTVPLVELTLQTVEVLMGPMTDFMGVTPLLDGSVADDGGDAKIDFYVLYDDEVYPRGDPSVAFDNSENGFARPLKPRVGATAPGLVGLRRSLVGGSGADTRQYRLTIAHEIFHLLQFARNEQYMTQDAGNHWFVEASATWGGWYFTPDARELVHPRYERFQQSPLSLHATGASGSEAFRHTYAAYIWPLFMHQEANSFAISQAWEDIAGVDNWTQADGVINNILNFDENFPTFALRNLNDKDEFGSALAPYFVDLDATFPDGEEPPIIEVDRLVLPGDTQTEVVSLPSLRAKYFHYTVDSEVQQLEVDVSDMAPPEHFNAQMVAKIRGKGWKVIPLPGGVSMFCPDDPEQDIEEFYLVLSNTDMVIDHAIEGTYTVRDLDEPCSCQDFSNIEAFEGRIEFAYDKTAENSQYRYEIHQSAVVTFTMPVTSFGPGGVTYLGFLNGQGSINDSETFKSNPPSTYTIVGQSQPVNGDDPIDLSRAYIHFKFDDCTYNFGTVPYIHASSDGHPNIYEVASVRSGDRPIPSSLTSLTGEEPFRAHSIDWGLENEGDAYFSAGFGQSMFDWGVVNENNAGEALITWTLTPVYGE